MLYVFHVNCGHMLTFDMKLALETVNVLKDAIEQQYSIKGVHQVLLVSGGVVLQPSTRVCSYTAGTDTNPIFMFSRSDGQKNIQPWPSIDNNDTEIKEQMVHCFNLPATYETVVKRAELALQICEMAKDELKICEKLVHEQHLQQQGWAAVMANMEDLTGEFRQRLENFSSVFNEHIKRRDEYLEFLSHFNKDLHKLAKIPILSNLLLDGPNAKEFNLKFNEYLGDVVESLTQTPIVDDGHGGGGGGIIDSSKLTIRTVTTTTTTTTTTIMGDSGGSTINENIKIKDIDKNSNNINNELETSQRIRSQSPSRSREQSHNNNNNNDSTQIKSKELELTNLQKFKGITLLQWISAKENQVTLEKLAENCIKGLNQIGDSSVNILKVNVTEAIRAAEQEDVKQIKGLEIRLCGLERLMFEAKRIVQEQSELSTSFQHNQLRAGNLGDTSILPDLCASHSQQLRVMAKNHKTLRDIRRRISKAKDELAENLSTRLSYIVLLENRMSELDNKMVFFHRCLRRLQRHLIIMEQIHSAPNIYATAITEVVRRRHFSSAFLMWASDLANHLLTLHNEETIKRKEFSRLFDDHFLMVLFPGMRDLPPTYGTQAPTIFDADLPNLNENDIEMLSTYLNYLDIPLRIEQPNMKPIQEFFLQTTAANSSSSNNNNTNNDNNKNNNINNDNNIDNDNKNISQHDDKSCSASADSAGDSKLNENSINIPRPLDLHAHLKDGFESETDTEEFEKVGQSPIERRQISSLVTASLQHQQLLLDNNQLDSVENKPETCDISTSTETPITHNIETLTEDNLGATRIELERIRKISFEMLRYSNILMEMLRQQNDDIKTLKSFINDMRFDYERELMKLLELIEQIRQQDVQMQRETINRLTVDHELELNDIKKLLYGKDEEIHGLKLTTENLCDRIKELESMETNEIKSLREKVTALENEKLKWLSIKDKELNELREKLQRDHKTEVESLRSRFKLMTSRDRTPSETSLEKIERPDLLDLGGMESMSIGSGITIDHRLPRHTVGVFGSPKSPSSGSTGAYDLYKKILEEKERQLDVLRENEQRLVKENSQMKHNLQQVMNAEMASALDEDPHHHHHQLNVSCASAAAAVADAANLKEQMKVLAKAKEKLEIELCMQRSKRSEMDSSVAMIKGMEASPNRLKSMCAKPCVNIESCTKGDLVIVVWDSEHGQYKILQETPLLYFLHADSHPSLNLIPGTTSSSSPATLAISSSPNNTCATSIQMSTSPTNPIQSTSSSSSSSSSTTAAASLPKSLYCIGRVIEKEFCYARKDENRYKVTKGTKFYRVKVRPRSPVRGITTGNEGGSSKVRKGISFDAEKTSQIMVGDGSISVPVSRSTSTNLLINSFAQTDLLDPVNEDNVIITTTSPAAAASASASTTTINTSQQTIDKSLLINKINTSVQSTNNDEVKFTLSDGSSIVLKLLDKCSEENRTAIASTSSPIVKQKFIDVDMIDSGVEAQQKIIYKERNISETDNNNVVVGGDGEPLSFTTFTQELTTSTAIGTAAATARITSTTTTEGIQQSSCYNQTRHRYISVSEEDENILDNVSSSHCEKSNKPNNNNRINNNNSDYKKSIGIFTLIEPLILPIQLALDD